MKCVTDSNMMNKEQAAEEATMAGYDWSQWERKGLDAATIAEVKGIMEAAAAAEGAAVPEMIKENKLDELEKEIKAAFEGSGGFLEEAAKQEKAAEAAMLQCIADLEKLEVDALGLRDVTIAESACPPPHARCLLPPPPLRSAAPKPCRRAAAARERESRNVRCSRLGGLLVRVRAVLEREPELREEIEEEIRNNNWGY